MSRTENQSREQSLELLLRGLRIPSFVARHQEVAMRAEKEGWSFGQYLHHLAEVEHEDRRIRRIERALRRSRLPSEKTLATLELDRLPAKVRRQVPALCEGGFVDRAENILAFGLPGRGKTHLLCAVGHELIQRGYRVLFAAAYQLVQRLLVAKRDLVLEKELRRLDAFDLVIVDDIGYVQQDRDEMEVLFTFFGERYERRSVAISSNLVFSQWDRIFKDPMTTAAAVDRLVHHATILELTCRSYRGDKALAHNGVSDPEPPEDAS
ncbi:MAG: ATP-binding protein [Propionibacteriaceae bacterium]|nr:ATP-binding protein [Propionibacteriaceae bacterium]